MITQKTPTVACAYKPKVEMHVNGYLKQKTTARQVFVMAMQVGFLHDAPGLKCPHCYLPVNGGLFAVMYHVKGQLSKWQFDVLPTTVMGTSVNEAAKRSLIKWLHLDLVHMHYACVCICPLAETS